MLSYDETFDTRLATDFIYNFSVNHSRNNEKEKSAIIDSHNRSPKNRDVRIHVGFDLVEVCALLVDY